MSVADDSLMPVAHTCVVAPSLLPRALAEIVVAAARAGRQAGARRAGAASSRRPRRDGDRRQPRRRRAQGDPARQPRRAASRGLAALRAGAGARGAHRRDARLPRPRRRTASAATSPARCRRRAASTRRRCSTDPRKAYLLLHAEPEFDCANPVAARAALEQAEFVVVLSPFRARHRVRRRAAADRPVHRNRRHVRQLRRPRAALQRRRASRSAKRARRGRCCACWARCSGLPGFDFETIERRARDACRPDADDRRRGSPTARASRSPRPAAAAHGLERVADVPIYFADPLVRRAPSLQQTADARRRARG